MKEVLENVLNPSIADHVGRWIAIGVGLIMAARIGIPERYRLQVCAWLENVKDVTFAPFRALHGIKHK